MDVRDELRYAKSGDVAIAYATYGTGPPDIVFAHGFAGNIEIERETPFQRAFHDRAASFSRFVLFDPRGTGLSDRPREPATLAGPGEVLVSSTVKDIVAGSDLNFEDRGVTELKGVPGEWRLFAVA